MRRLPIYFLLDISESMAGENLVQLEEGLAQIVKRLRTDPHALETVWISVIAFAGKVKQLAPLTELVMFSPPELPVGGGTSLGAALEFLMTDIDRNVAKNTPTQKGDWKPIVFLMTDGRPTDNAGPAADKWVKDFQRRANLVAIALGHSADLTLLRSLTENAFVLTPESDVDFHKFIAWITHSVQAHSRAIGDGRGKDDAVLSNDEIIDSILQKVDLTKGEQMVDETGAFFVSKCQRTRQPYLSRYEPMNVDAPMDEGRVPFKVTTYGLAGVYKLKKSYFDLSSDTPSLRTVNTDALHGFPSCPHCNNPFGFAMCSCGNTFCVAGGGQQTCPWCEKTAMFGRATESDGGIDITRARG